ncbi:MAG: OmpH family outer membrane protein [Lentisphaerae bacterium]|jgi:Skp family chaperone for outer membrane proteins|nr:OmpH family outer membrane protein [Lentisphaerota bacterium]
MRNCVLILLATACLAGTVFGQAPTIAVVDLEELVSLHPNTAADKKLLEQTLKEFTAEKEELKERFEKARDAFEEAVKEVQNPALSEKAKKKAEDEALKRRTAALNAEREMSERVRALQRQLTEQEVRMLKRTASEIEDAIAGYARAKKIDLVLQLPGEKLGAVSGVLYAAPPLNITTNIMTLLGIRPEAAEKPSAEAGKP